MPSHRRDRDRKHGRRAPYRDPRPRLLVVCEGERTERDYIEDFRKAAGTPAGLVVVVPHGGGSPISIIDQAIELRDTAEKEARRQGDPTLAYNAAWCIYDVDDHSPAVRSSALEKARDARVNVAVSNPSFELWLYLHFADSPGMQTRQWLHAQISKHVGRYGKKVQYAKHFEAGHPKAVDRAERLDKAAEKAGEHGRNPTTGVYRLTRAIEAAGDDASGSRA